MEFSTADLCDRFEQELRANSIRVAEPIFKSYGGRRAFFGTVSTLKVFEDNSLVRAAVEEPGRGRILVVDGGGSLRCALVGDRLAASAAENNWAGIVVFGCIRDARDIGAVDIGVVALATHPLRSVKKGVGEREVPLHFGGVTILPQEYLYADDDGVMISPKSLHEQY